MSIITCCTIGSNSEALVLQQGRSLAISDHNVKGVKFEKLVVLAGSHSEDMSSAATKSQLIQEDPKSFHVCKCNRSSHEFRQAVKEYFNYICLKQTLKRKNQC